MIKLFKSYDPMIGFEFNLNINIMNGFLLLFF